MLHHVCPECDRAFTSKNPDAKTCSGRCRQRAYTRRQRERSAARADRVRALRQERVETLIRGATAGDVESVRADLDRIDAALAAELDALLGVD